MDDVGPGYVVAVVDCLICLFNVVYGEVFKA